MRLNWPEGDGRNAMSCFLEAAALVCDQHKVALQVEGAMQPTRHNITASVLNYGGRSSLNDHNCRYAMKMTFGDKVEELRNPEIWCETAGDDPDPEKTWRFQNTVPDGILLVTREDTETLVAEYDGLLVGAITSDEDDQSTSPAESQAYIQALQGLSFRPTTAALVMAPHSAVFIHITLEGGFINTRKKRYAFRPRNMEDSAVDATAFKTLFRDVVLYLWNNHFESYCSRIP